MPNEADHADDPKRSHSIRPADKTGSGARSGAGSGSERERRVIGAGSILFKQGDGGDEAFLIQEGRIELSMRGKNERRVVLNELTRGDLFGEMALIGGGTRLATATAISDVVVVVVTRHDFQSRLDAMDPVMRRVLLTLTDKLRTMSERHVDEVAKIR